LVTLHSHDSTHASGAGSTERYAIPPKKTAACTAAAASDQQQHLLPQ
jgi:hypothetical protein